MKNGFFEVTIFGIVISMLKSTRISISMNFLATLATDYLWLKTGFSGWQTGFSKKQTSESWSAFKNPSAYQFWCTSEQLLQPTIYDEKPVFRGKKPIFCKPTLQGVISEASLVRSPIFTWTWCGCGTFSPASKFPQMVCKKLMCLLLSQNIIIGLNQFGRTHRPQQQLRPPNACADVICPLTN